MVVVVVATRIKLTSNFNDIPLTPTLKVDFACECVKAICLFMMDDDTRVEVQDTRLNATEGATRGRGVLQYLL